MSNETIYMADYDMKRLRELLQFEKLFIPVRENLQGLEAELSCAQVVASREILWDTQLEQHSEQIKKGA